MSSLPPRFRRPFYASFIRYPRAAALRLSIGRAWLSLRSTDEAPAAFPNRKTNI